MRRSILGTLLLVGIVLFVFAATEGPVMAQQARQSSPWLEPDREMLTLAVPDISITKTDTLHNDANGDGMASPGDTLRYEITIINNSDEAVATDVVFSDTPDGNTTLVAGSVQTTQGTITSGNDGHPPVTVDIGTISELGIVAISFDVTVNDPLPRGVSQVANQGTISGGNIPTEDTDDPDAPGPNDPTITLISFPPVPVGGHLSPVDRAAVARAAFGPWIMPSLALVVIIGFAGVTLIRRRPLT